MRVAVTGGTGFIGSRVVRMLRERGDDVVCLARDPSKASTREPGGAARQGDILDRESLQRAFAVATA
jgi:uncharacterized protein YbjT (DUF2867 family)